MRWDIQLKPRDLIFDKWYRFLGFNENIDKQLVKQKY